MAQEYKRLDTAAIKEVEKLFNGGLILSIVDGNLKEIHVKLPDNKFITISKSSQYTDDLSILMLVKPKVYIAKFNMILQDDSVEEVTKEFTTEEERDNYVNFKLTHQQSEEVKLLEREIG